MTHLPSKSTDFVSSDSDAMIQQLLILDDGEVDIPIDPIETDLFFLLSMQSLPPTQFCAPFRMSPDDTASDPATISEARKSKYWTEWRLAMHGYQMRQSQRHFTF